MQDKRDAERWPPLAHEHVELLALCCCEKGNTAICVSKWGEWRERQRVRLCAVVGITPSHMQQPRKCLSLSLAQISLPQSLSLAQISLPQCLSLAQKSLPQCLSRAQMSLPLPRQAHQLRGALSCALFPTLHTPHNRAPSLPSLSACRCTCTGGRGPKR